MNPTEDYRIKLDIFEGPLDLLLYLINKEEIDIYNIPISYMLNHYITYIETSPSYNQENIGDFLLLAAELIFIKSQMLLKKKEEAQEDDPRKELVQKLLEYKKFREAGQMLFRRNILGRDVFSRNITLQDLVTKRRITIEKHDIISAFIQFLDEAKNEPKLTVKLEKYHLEDALAELRKEVENRTELCFRDIISFIKEKIVMILKFLALLELTKSGKIRLEQNELFGPIKVIRC